MSPPPPSSTGTDRMSRMFSRRSHSQSNNLTLATPTTTSSSFTSHHHSQSASPSPSASSQQHIFPASHSSTAPTSIEEEGQQQQQQPPTPRSAASRFVGGLQRRASQRTGTAPGTTEQQQQHQQAGGMPERSTSLDQSSFLTAGGGSVANNSSSSSINHNLTNGSSPSNVQATNMANTPSRDSSRPSFFRSASNQISSRVRKLSQNANASLSAAAAAAAGGGSGSSINGHGDHQQPQRSMSASLDPGASSSPSQPQQQSPPALARIPPPSISGSNPSGGPSPRRSVSQDRRRSAGITFSADPTMAAAATAAFAGFATGAGRPVSSSSAAHGFGVREESQERATVPTSAPMGASASSGSITAPGAGQASAAAATSSSTGSGSANATNTGGATHRIRLVPHLEATRSLHFEPIERDVREGLAAIKIGRFTDRNTGSGGNSAGGTTGGAGSATMAANQTSSSAMAAGNQMDIAEEGATGGSEGQQQQTVEQLLAVSGNAGGSGGNGLLRAPGAPGARGGAIPNAMGGSARVDTNRVAFKSKVVSRSHAELWCEPGGSFFLRDTKSSSGTFLNHIRLSGPNHESKPFPLKDGDIIQLGVDYQGGTEEIYRCVKMRVELNRGWQRAATQYNVNALRQLRALQGQPIAATTPTPDSANATTANGARPSTSPAPLPTNAQSVSVTDCCICLFSVTVCQSLFIAPCSHVFHYKCIRPLLLRHHPGFSCPLCRTFADLEADVEEDEAWQQALMQEALAGTHPHTVPTPTIESDTPILEVPAPSTADAAGSNSNPGSIGRSQSSHDGRPPLTALQTGDFNMEEQEEMLASATDPHDTEMEDATTGSASRHGNSRGGNESSLPIPIDRNRNSNADIVGASVEESRTPLNQHFLSTLAETSAAGLPPPPAGLSSAPTLTTIADVAGVGGEHVAAAGSPRPEDSNLAAAATLHQQQLQQPDGFASRARSPLISEIVDSRRPSVASYASFSSTGAPQGTSTSQGHGSSDAWADAVLSQDSLYHQQPQQTSRPVAASPSASTPRLHDEDRRNSSGGSGWGDNSNGNNGPSPPRTANEEVEEMAVGQSALYSGRSSRGGSTGGNKGKDTEAKGKAPAGSASDGNSYFGRVDSIDSTASTGTGRIRSASGSRSWIGRDGSDGGSPGSGGKFGRLWKKASGAMGSPSHS